MQCREPLAGLTAVANFQLCQRSVGLLIDLARQPLRAQDNLSDLFLGEWQPPSIFSLLKSPFQILARVPLVEACQANLVLLQSQSSRHSFDHRHQPHLTKDRRLQVRTFDER